MRIAVAGGTGRVGSQVVELLRAGGHEPVVLARSAGVDLVTGEGLERRLDGVACVIDATSTTELDPAAAVSFFEEVTTGLLAAEQRAGVRHHLVLSIVGIDRVSGTGHYAGKRRQEQVVEAGDIPWTIQRATQFHDFAGMVAGWTTQDGVATVAPLLVQPVASAEVAEVLVELAQGPALCRAPDLAGPRQEDLVDMARRTLAAQGSDVRVQASWQGGPFRVELAGEVMLPLPGARIAPTTFDDWLATRRAG